jgi:hypothetical protein
MSSALRKLAVALSLLLLAGCHPLAAAPPPPTAWPVRIQYTPALTPRLAALQDCAAQIPGAGLLVDELPARLLDPAKADLVLRLGLPANPPGFSAQIGADQVVAIVNPINPVTLHAGDLAAIFSGQVRAWADLSPVPALTPGSAITPTPIHLWTYAPGDDVRDAFVNTFLSGAAISARAGIAPDPSDLLQAVADDPSAIGYLPGSVVTDRVRVVDVSGEGPGQAPLLALAQSEPQGPARALLACLQKGSVGR